VGSIHKVKSSIAAGRILSVLSLAILSSLISCGYNHQPYEFELLDSSPSGSPFSRVHFMTNGPIKVTTDCSIFSSYPNNAEASLLVNGRYSQTLRCTSDQPQTFSLAVERGSIIDIVSGTRIRLTPESPVTGNTIENVSGSALAAPEPVKPLVVVYGDSISCGFGTDIPSRDAWTVLLRTHYETGVEAWGARQLTSDYAAGLNNLISYFASYGNPATIWLAIGVNDFFAGVNPAQFQGEYASLLDSIHSNFPSVQIFAQTPLVLANEAPNASGGTLAQFRSAISTVCNSRSYCHLVDGTLILSPADLSSDGVHPTTQGNAKYEAYVSNVLQTDLR
jgi:lysophospholipase L1-like esterase